jgi:hypothetical protein
MKPHIIDRPLVLKSVEQVVGEANLAIAEDGSIVIANRDLKIDEEKNEALRLKHLAQTEALVKKFIVIASDEIMKAAEGAAELGIKTGLQKRKTLFDKGKWTGESLGTAQDPIVDVYSKGEFKGLRLENAPGLPESSAKSIGRVCLNASDEQVYIDLGNRQKRVSLNRLEIDIQVSDPKEPIVVVCEKSDATKMIIQVFDCSNDFERIGAKIKTPSPKKIVVELPENAQVGTYRIVGIE